MNLSAKIAYNTLIQVAGKILATVLSFISLMLMTRYLGPSSFGEYTTAFTFISIFAVCADFGLTLVTSRLLSAPEANEKKIISNLFGLRIVLAVGLVGLAPLLIFTFPYSASVKIAVLFGAAGFVFPLFNQIFVGFFQKKLNLIYVAIAEVVNRIIFLAAIIISIQKNFGLNGIMIGLTISAFASFLIHYYFAGKETNVRPAWDFKYWGEILKTSWPLAVTIILNLLYLKADTLLLSLFKPQQEVGLYGAAYRIVEVLNSLPYIFAGLILPVLSAAWLSKNLEKYHKVLQKSFDLTMIAVIPLIVGGQMVAGGIIYLMAGKDYFAAGPILQILLVAVGFVFISCLFTHAIIAIDKQKKIIGAYLFTSVSALALYLWLIPRYSYYGAAIATVYSELAISAASIYLVYRYSSFRPNLKILPKVLASSFLMSLFLFFSPKTLKDSNWGIVALIIGGAIIYFLALYLLRGLKKSDIRSVLNKKSNLEIHV
ncbi:MAG: flippase [Patescibacteria group bacterium]|nr:flippase [Patescibacteria group bacterium]